MLSRSTRCVLAVALTVGSAATVALGTADPAAAAAPTQLTVTDVAPRGSDAGRSATLAQVDATTVTTAPDGSALYYDSEARQVRRVDATTRTISIVAGTGAVGGSTLDGSKPATQVALPPITQLWSDRAGDVLALLCAGVNCAGGRDVYRLDAGDGRWHLAVANPAGSTGLPRYAGFAAASDGAVLVADAERSVLRRFGVGDDPSTGGTIVAGVDGVSGTDGDGNPALGTPITVAGPITVYGPDDVYFADGYSHVRRVAPDGTLDTLADPGTASITALASAADGATVYVLRTDALRSSTVRALPVSGDPARLVAGPLPGCDSGTRDCLATALSEAPYAGATNVLVAGQGSILAWPADGSDPTAYRRYAGVLNDVDGVRSPDGTALRDTYLTGYDELAVAPSGAIAFAARDAIHTVSGTSADATFGTALNGTAHGLQYAADDTLYALVDEPSPHVVAIAPGGGVTTVLGGGTTEVGDDVRGTDVQLHDDAQFAVDPTDRTLTFHDGDAVLWRLDAGGTVHRLADLSAVTNRLGALAVGADHVVRVADGIGLRTVGTDGTVTTVDCTAGCPDTNLHVLAGGTVVGASNGEAVARASDGTLRHYRQIGGLFGVTSDRRFVVPGTGGRTGGLLAVSGPITAPSAVDPPTVTVTTVPGGVDVHVDPTVARQRIRIVAGAEQDVTTSSSTGAAYDRSFRHLGSRFPQRPDASVRPTYRVEVVASTVGGTSTDAVDNGPQVFDRRPAADTTAPGAPKLGITNHGTSVTITVNRPVDADLDRVVVCRTAGSTVPAGPWDCADRTETDWRSSFPATLQQTVDPLATTSFTAFAVDASSNASAGVTVRRAAATLTTGAAVTRIGYDARTDAEEVTWREGFPIRVAYAPGTTTPKTLAGGTAVGAYSSFFGTGAQVPVAAGAKVAVSIFAWTDSTLTKYRRSSFVLTGGTNSDVTTIASTPVVDSGTRPTVTASMIRNSPTEGAVPLSNQQLALYHRPVGTKTWYFLTSSNTDAAGTVTFNSVPVPVAATDYLVRYYPFDSRGERLSTEPVRTGVRQVVKATVPTSGVHGKPVKVTGTITPQRAATVYLQRALNKKWTTVASAPSAASGAFAISYTPAAAGEYKLRLAVRGTDILLAGTTTTRTLTVR